MGYTTADDVKNYSQLSYSDLGFSDDTAFTNFINTLIGIAEDIIDDYCDVPDGFFDDGGVKLTEYYDSDGSGELWLKHRPVISITSLQYNEKGPTETPSWVSLTEGPGDDTHYLIYPEKGFIYIYSKIPPAGKRNIKVVYTAGYSATPEPVAHVCKELVANVLRGVLKRKLAPQDLTALVTSGGENLRAFFAEDWKLTQAHRRLLAPYRRALVAVG